MRERFNVFNLILPQIRLKCMIIPLIMFLFQFLFLPLHPKCLKMRKVLVDAHTHTVASGHAFSSLQEMAKAAADMGLEVLGITEHGPSVPGTCPTLYFKNMFTVPRQMYGIRLLMGCEINILDTKGSLDLTDEQIGWLDLDCF